MLLAVDSLRNLTKMYNYFLSKKSDITQKELKIFSL